MGPVIKILHLYPNNMDTYGDSGNVLVLRKRLHWLGYDTVVFDYNVGDEFPNDVDVVFGGGGQNVAQTQIYEDLLSIGDKINCLVNDDVPMLLVCGLYQLFGKTFQVDLEVFLPGLGIFDIETISVGSRAVGNIVVDSFDFGVLFGYENHAGKTFFVGEQKSLGEVVVGVGNNGEDRSEGSRFRNVLGTYLHGAVLPRNPKLADFFVDLCIERFEKKYENFVLEKSVENVLFLQKSLDWAQKSNDLLFERLKHK